MSRGDLTDAEWRIFDPFFPDRGERGPLIKGKRRTVNGILWVLRTGAARHAKAIRQLELGYRALYPLEQAWGLGRSLRDTGFAACRRGACHRFDNRAGAPTCSRRKRGNQEKQALGRSRGGFSTKIHLRTNAKGNPLTFDLTGGEVHETQGFDALMELHDAQLSSFSATKAMIAMRFVTISQSAASNPRSAELGLAAANGIAHLVPLLDRRSDLISNRDRQPQ